MLFGYRDPCNSSGTPISFALKGLEDNGGWPNGLGRRELRQIRHRRRYRRPRRAPRRHRQTSFRLARIAIPAGDRRLAAAFFAAASFLLPAAAAGSHTPLFNGRRGLNDGHILYAPAVPECCILDRARTAAGFHPRLHGRGQIALYRDVAGSVCFAGLALLR